MSRVEENQKMIDRIGNVRFSSGDMAMLASVLTDISQSLAVIADCCLDKWQKDQVDRFVSIPQEDRKLYCDYTGLDETAVINRLKASMPRSKVDQFNDKYGRTNDGN